MGWSRGTEIFDALVGVALAKEMQLTDGQKLVLFKALIAVLEAADWDTQDDSAYAQHPLIQQAFRELEKEHPEDLPDLFELTALDRYGQELEIGMQVILDDTLYTIERTIQDDGQAIGDDVLRFPRLRLVDSNGYWTECFADEVEKR